LIKFKIIFSTFILLLAMSCEKDSMSIHDKAFVVDTHNDVLLRSLTGRDILKNLPESHSDLPKFREGGIDLQVFSIWVSPTEFKDAYYARANYIISQLEFLCSRVPDKWSIPHNYQDIIYNEQRGVLSCMIGVEGGHVIENDLNKIDELHKRGMRYLGVTWNNSNEWATSAKDETQAKQSLDFIGLTEFGEKVIQRCNKLGVIVDISHAGEQTVSDILRVTEKPIIASHSSVYDLCPHYRNLKDDQLLAIRENGGVVFVNFYPGYIDSTFENKARNIRQLNSSSLDSISKLYKQDSDSHWYKTNEILAPHLQKVAPGIDVVVKHIDYIVDLIGIDHVGIGGDWDGVEILPSGIEHIGKMPLLTKKLLNRGYSISDLKKILGGNFKRVFKEVNHL
tara:strand:+ start:691 stop:1872 length:1182 start_codon:yes stop_codon:yes gene_type:complete